MLYALFTILIVVGIAYRREMIQLKDANKSFFYRNRKFFILIGMSAIPVIFVNIYYKEGHQVSPKEFLEEAMESGSRRDVLDAYEWNLRIYPDSVPLYLGYIDAYIEPEYYRCERIDFRSFTTDPELLGICTEYQEAFCDSLEGEVHYMDVHDFDLLATPYINYVRGIKADKAAQLDQAEHYFRQEILVNSGYDKSYMKLYELYSKTNSPKLDLFLLNAKNAEHLPNRLLNYEYFRMGSYGKYLYTIFTERYLNIRFIAFFSGLIISFVWLIYLRSMDIFNKERWVDLITVFIGGIFLTHFCLPIYDYASYVLHWSINGDFVNDFMYCTVVIGGAEETVKLIPWVVFALVTKKMKEPFDYILYASVSALGFAFAENWMYLEYSGNIVIRFMMSTVGHMFFASILAYSVILARYKFKKRFWKIITPIIGFLLACYAHGFYDFWLISPSTRGLSIITTGFFILSIHIWFFLKKNAMNHSRFYKPRSFNVSYQLNLFMFAVVGILVLEYTLVSVNFGTTWSNSSLRNSAWMICAFLLYMTSILTNFQPVQGVWLNYKLPKIPGFFSRMFSIPKEQEEELMEKNLIGLPLRMFTPKTNPYIGKLLPISGTCEQQLTISGNPNWYLVKLNKKLGYPKHDQEYVLVKSKSIQKSLEDDKIEIYFMLIPEGVDLHSTNLQVGDLRYTGKVYSRPI